VSAGELLGRSYALTVGTSQFTGLRCEFDVKKSLGKDPNTAEIKIYNLKESTRNALQSSRTAVSRLPVTLLAGYGSSTGILFQGDVRHVDSSREGPDWITKITSGDGERAYQTARLKASFRPGTTISDVVRGAAGALGVGLGNLQEALAKPFRGGVSTLQNGYSVSGDAQEILDTVLRSAGFSVSIQDGQLTILRDADTLTLDAVLLSPDTGLIGSPQFGTPESGDKVGAKPPRLKVKSLLNSKIQCGRAIQVQSAQYQGAQYRAEVVHHQGDTHGEAWFSESELKLS
jgi:hypothetical protein